MIFNLCGRTVGGSRLWSGEFPQSNQAIVAWGGSECGVSKQVTISYLHAIAMHCWNYFEQFGQFRIVILQGCLLEFRLFFFLDTIKHLSPSFFLYTVRAPLNCIHNTYFFKSKNVFSRNFFLKFWAYVWLVFKSGFLSRLGYDGKLMVSGFWFVTLSLLHLLLCIGFCPKVPNW